MRKTTASQYCTALSESLDANGGYTSFASLPLILDLLTDTRRILTTQDDTLTYWIFDDNSVLINTSFNYAPSNDIQIIATTLSELAATLLQSLRAKYLTD